MIMINKQQADVQAQQILSMNYLMEKASQSTSCFTADYVVTDFFFI